jgi:CheY-like chemotaxis protein
VDSEFDLPADLWSCAIDPEQISRVIQNLAVNAAQAMPDGGTLHVSARNVDAVPRLGPGRFVRVSVRDQGPGIAPENVPRIFEPYFSTKAGGTGLGLATAFRIVRQHQGDITVASTPGMGACFEVWLPAAAEAPAADPPTPRASGKGGARVLVLDDDQSIRDVSCAMLRRLGYEPEAVREGCEAVRIANEARMAGRPFGVAILDLTVPDGMGGLETLARLKEEHPGVRAIVSSGYSSDPVMADYSAHGFAGVLEKPYRLDEMAVVIERVLRK